MTKRLLFKLGQKVETKVQIPAHIRMHIHVHSYTHTGKVEGGGEICMYVCMAITYSKSMHHPGKVANPARGQLNRENQYFLLGVRAREFGI